jgi:glycosyltransferase involved in cell wall biosynthesis
MKIAINVLFITYNRGGPKTYILNLLRNLIRIDKKNQYFLFVAGYNKELFENFQNHLEIIEIPMRRYNTMLRFLIEQLYLPNLTRKYKIDLLFCPGNIGIVFAQIKQLLGIQGLLIFRGLKKNEGIERFNPFVENFLRILIKASIRRAHKIIAVSNFTKKCLKNEFKASESKIKVVYEGVDTGYFEKISFNVCETQMPYRPYILSVGILFKYKNIDRVIQAFSILKKTKKIPHSLVIVGRDHGGNLRGLKILTENLGIRKWVCFKGQIPYEKLAAYYKCADLFVFPSQIESFGLPTLESMASGTPVVASNRTAVPEIVGEAGLIFDPENIEEMVEVMYKALIDGKLKKNLIKKGYNRVKEFSWEKTAKEILRVIEGSIPE